jgi:hypothetical protein
MSAENATIAVRLGSRVIFLAPAIGEFGEAWPGHEVDALDQFLDQRPDCVGPQEQCFVEATCMQQPVGEHMAAVKVGAQLDLVDRQKRDRDIHRHRLDRAHPVARAGWNDFFLTGHQRHRELTGARNDAVIHLACQQPQRQADHAGRVRQHPFDGVVGLAGVGGAENGGDCAVCCHAFPVGCWRSRPASGFKREQGVSES